MTETTEIRASLFENEKRFGKEFKETINFHKAVGKKVSLKEVYSDRYQGTGAYTLVNALRGTKNFHDGQWQGWLGNDLEAIIDLEKEETIQQVVVGSMENQGSGIYFPTAIQVLVSSDGEKFEEVGTIERAFAKNGISELKDFKVTFKERTARYIKVLVTNEKKIPSGGRAWLFVDEILID